MAASHLLNWSLNDLLNWSPDESTHEPSRNTQIQVNYLLSMLPVLVSQCGTFAKTTAP